MDLNGAWTFYEVFFCFVEQPKENYSPYAFAFICGLDEKGVSRATVYDTLKMERWLLKWFLSPFYLIVYSLSAKESVPNLWVEMKWENFKAHGWWILQVGFETKAPVTIYFHSVNTAWHNLRCCFMSCWSNWCCLWVKFCKWQFLKSHTR